MRANEQLSQSGPATPAAVPDVLARRRAGRGLTQNERGPTPAGVPAASPGLKPLGQGTRACRKSSRAPCSLAGGPWRSLNGPAWPETALRGVPYSARHPVHTCFFMYFFMYYWGIRHFLLTQSVELKISV